MFVVAQKWCVYCITILRLNFEHSGVLMYKCILCFACLNAISKLCPSIEQAYIVSMIIEREICCTILYYNFHTQPLQDASCIYKNMWWYRCKLSVECLFNIGINNSQILQKNIRYTDARDKNFVTLSTPSIHRFLSVHQSSTMPQNYTTLYNWPMYNRASLSVNSTHASGATHPWP